MLYMVSFVFSMMNNLNNINIVGIFIMSFFSLSVIFLKMMGSSMVFFCNQFYPLFMDDVSFFLIVLSFLVSFLSIFSSFYHVKKAEMSKYVFLMMFILFMLVFLFSISNYFSFFVVFEFIMMPMVFIIGIWGSQKERLTANYYFFFYTLLGSVPLMMCVLSLVKESNSFFFLMKLSNGISMISFSSLLIIILAFLCKLPFYSVHIWLPKAHVEAPVSSSMVLASLLLKMSGYSMFRVFMLLFVSLGMSKFIFFCFMMVGILYPMFICLRQVDLKSFIAYSSISHMAIALASLLMYNFYGFLGGIIVFLGHSLISPMMFYSVNLIYERISTRMVVSMGSFEFNMKFFFFYFLLIFVSNMSYPPFVSFFSELILYFSIMTFNFYVIFFLFVFLFFSSVVMIYFLVKIFKSKSLFGNFFFLSFREIMIYWMGIYLLCLMTFMVFIF